MYRGNKILCVAVALAAALSLSACVPGDFFGYDEYYGGNDDDYMVNEETFYCYNGYTGLEVMIPEGYYVVEFNDVNLTQAPGESADIDFMDWYAYGDGGYGYDLTGIQNMPGSEYNDHSMLYLTFERYPDVDYDMYLDIFTEYALEDGEYYQFRHMGNETVRLQDRTYTKLLFEARDMEDYSNYYLEEYYITPAGEEGDGLYFIAYINYWPDSGKSKKD
ncbi:MAG: hypothetical protein LBV27_09955, partial [Oscillospiraceae bacterium]|nr:hypothetical protein [Oscillospiraceae bacterium]